MVRYQCYLIGDDDWFAAADEFEADTDYSAIVTAHQLMGQRPAHTALEVWKYERRVYAESRGANAAAYPSGEGRKIRWLVRAIASKRRIAMSR
jgi:hypothetical protein